MNKEGLKDIEWVCYCLFGRILCDNRLTPLNKIRTKRGKPYTFPFSFFKMEIEAINGNVP